MDGQIRPITFNESMSNMEKISGSFIPLHLELRRQEPDRDVILQMAAHQSHTIDQCLADAANRNAVRQLIKDRVRVVESEHRREAELDLNIPVAEVKVLVSAIADVINRLVPSADLRRWIRDELIALSEETSATLANVTRDIRIRHYVMENL